jgi:hypothetical protein
MKANHNIMLSERQILFCNEYVVDYIGARAYIRAGYEANNARAGSCDLLADAEIQAYLSVLIKERGNRVQMTADDVFNEIVSIAKDDISNYVEFDEREVIRYDKDGKPFPENIVNIKLKDSTQICTKNIKKVTRGKDGQFTFELYSRQQALKDMGEIYTMFTQKVKLDSDPVDIEKLSDEDKIAYITLMRKIRG